MTISWGWKFLFDDEYIMNPKKYKGSGHNLDLELLTILY